MIDFTDIPEISESKLQRLFSTMTKIWLRVPRVYCKGLCQRECGNVPVTPIEALFIERKYHVTLPSALHGNGAFKFKTLGVDEECCPFLTDRSTNGQCSIYNDRPMVCRAYGHDLDSLKCPFGCKVERPLKPFLLAKFYKELKSLIDPTKSVAIQRKLSDN